MPLPGRAFTRRLLDLACSVSAPRHRVRLTSAADLQWWAEYLPHWSGTFPLIRQTTLPQTSSSIRTVHDGALARATAVAGGVSDGRKLSSWVSRHPGPDWN